MYGRQELARLIAHSKQSSKAVKPHLRGRMYELMTEVAFAERFGPLGLQQLQVVGQAGDRGVDLVGQWNNVQLLVQCKATGSKITGALWRDLGGVHTQRVSLANVPTLVALASPMPMTAAAHAEFLGSLHPFMHCILPLPRQNAPLEPLRSLVLNEAAAALLEANGIPELV